MPTSVFRGIFSEWAEVVDEFGVDIGEPDKVILAEYDGGEFEGFAILVYRNQGAYYYFEAQHCSQMRLEGQWQPTQYDDAAELIACLRRGSSRLLGARLTYLCQALALDANKVWRQQHPHLRAA